jgi:hypothetical protein
MVQHRIRPKQVEFKGENLNLVYRVLISRGKDNQLQGVAILMRASRDGKPANNSRETREITLKDVISEKRERDEARRRVYGIAVSAAEIIEKIANIEAGRQPDLIGVDLIEDKEGNIYILEMQGRDSGGFFDLDRRYEELG